MCCVMPHIIGVGVSFRWWWWDTLFDSLLFIASFDRTLVPIGSFFLSVPPRQVVGLVRILMSMSKTIAVDKILFLMNLTTLCFPSCMLSLGLTSYEMELWFSDLFTSYAMELETHVHVQIEKELGFNELQIAYYH